MSIKQSLFVLLVLPLVAIFSNTRIVGQQTKPSIQEPSVEWSAASSTDPKRLEKSKRYDRFTSGGIAESASDVEELPLNVHWYQGISALPVTKSDAIVIGYVFDAKAYLSSNRSVVYSEFSVRPLQILKNSDRKPLVAGTTFVAERWGGAVIFPSGKVQHYRISKQGLPHTDEEYVLFLKSNGEDFEIITGYSIGNGQVRPLDEGADLPFKKHEGQSVDSFLTELRKVIDTSTMKGSNQKWHTALTFPSR